jgi:YHS domain-containing protein
LTIRNRWVREERNEAQRAALGIGIASDGLDARGASPGRAAANLVASRACRLGRTAGPLEILADAATRSRAEEYVAGEVDWAEAELPDGEDTTIRVFRCARRRAHLYAVARSLELDPVCWVRVEPTKSVRRRIGGRTVHFCSAACAQKFADDPESFLV